MHRVNIHQAKTHLSRLIREVQAGGEVVISKGDVPLVKLVLVDEAPRRRQLGGAKGLITVAADFDAPLADFEPYER
ncbi:MAG: type II toxin-antitoxin system Phd/YefM family antitoxin [Deltaproteobacteria bacterium]|nr:type II toxin-antitoxin system Phd/YefM family antitoxin [Deltaproteobacteria bacterium]